MILLSFFLILFSTLVAFFSKGFNFSFNKYNTKISVLFKTWFMNPIPKPHAFVNQTLQASLGVELVDVVNQVTALLPQLSEFITQFNGIISEHSINVITETNGNMSIDVPSNMSDHQAQLLSKRVGVIDRLIRSRGQEIDKLLHQGLEIESKLKGQDPNFTSQILSKVEEFKKLNESYKH